MMGRRGAKRVGRRIARRMPRRVFRPALVRRPFVRRPLGTVLILGAAAGVIYKLGQSQARQVQEYTGVAPEQLSEEDLQAAMTDLDMQSEPLDSQDRQALAAEQPDYIDELKKLAELKNAGVITEAEFEAKKKKLLGL